MPDTDAPRITGRDLVALRASRNIRQAAIARSWGCSKSNVQRVENMGRPTPAALERYLAALHLAEHAS